jgi:hypothetical protein
VGADALIPALASAASVAASAAGLAYWLGKKFSEVDARFKLVGERLERVEERFDERFEHVEEGFRRVEERLERVEERLGRLESAFTAFVELLLSVLQAKGALAQSEVLGAESAVRALLPPPSSKYYTREVYERLKQLLDKDLDDYTMADISELEKIADLMEREGLEAGRRDLVDYSYKLRFLAMLIRVAVIYPKLRQAKLLPA